MKHFNKHYSQTSYLFVIYGAFILVLLSIFFLYTYNYYQKTTLTQASSDLENMCSSVNDSIHTQLDNMSTISLNLVYSNIIKSNFKEFTALNEQSQISPQDLVTSHEKVKAIHDVVTALIGAYQNAASINLYSMDGICVESGYLQRTYPVDLKSLHWYEPTLLLNGHKYITVPTVHATLPGKGENQRLHKFISLVRVFLNSNRESEGIVEVVQDCDTIFSLASQLESQNEDVSIIVYNSRNEVVYPYQQSILADNYLELLQTNGMNERDERVINTLQNESLLITFQKIDEYDWTVVLIRPEASVYASLRRFRSVFSIIAFFSILITLCICFFISRRLTLPLQKLTNATSKITINRVLDEKKVNLTSADSNIKELSQLCNSIRDMYEKLRSTSQEALLSRSEEVRAKLQATQSLVNPHFLYNCLTNMSIMAEENMNDDIIHMCTALCDFFRYISSSKEMLVPLEDEIFYSERYLECMKLRFSEEFIYHIELAEESKHLFIPKLILQPIIENAFKYAFNKVPPWQLHISSVVNDGEWMIMIEDNGGQLSDEKKTELLQIYCNLNVTEEVNSLQIGGMGLKNVYLRLKLLYGEKAIFKIDTSIPHKTIFIVGGPAFYSKEDYHDQNTNL